MCMLNHASGRALVPLVPHLLLQRHCLVRRKALMNVTIAAIGVIASRCVLVSVGIST